MPAPESGTNSAAAQHAVTTPTRMSLETKMPLLMSGVFVVLFAVSLTATYATLTSSAHDGAHRALARATQQLARLAESGVGGARPRYAAVAKDSVVRRALAAADKAGRATPPIRGDTARPSSIGAVLGRLSAPTDSGLSIELWSADKRLVAYIGNSPHVTEQGQSGPALVPASDVPFEGIPAVRAVDSVMLGKLYPSNGRAAFWLVYPILESGTVVGYIAKQGRIAVNPQTEKSLRALAGEAVSGYYRNDDGTTWTTLAGRVAVPSTPDADSAFANRPGVGRVLISEEHVAGTPLVLTMEIPEADVIAGPREAVRSLALLSMLLLVAGALASWIIARRVATPLRRITVAAEALARGDYSARVPATGENETMRLSTAFNHMAAEIADGTSALALRIAEAQAANHAKSDFLAKMSHELRTPLNAIGGYVSLMEMELRGPINEQQRRDLQRVQSAQEHLLGLISAMLDLERIESGRVTYDLEPVPLDQFLSSLDALIAPQARAKALELSYGATNPTAGALADREKLRQIVLNLLSNAIRYTPAGGRIAIDTARGIGDTVDIHVRDTGPGIPLDKQAQIFEPFVQLDRSLAQPREGVGLGLSISRDLARGMGGDLTVTSELGHGAQFTISLPFANISEELMIVSGEVSTARPGS